MAKRNISQSRLAFTKMFNTLEIYNTNVFPKCTFEVQLKVLS